MRSLEAIATPILLFAEGYISAFWDHNLEIRIGFQGQVTQAQGVRWGWEWALHKVPMSPHMPRMCHPVCQAHPCGPSPLPLCTCTFAWLFFLSSLFGEWWRVTVTAVYPSLQIALAMAGVTSVPRGWHPCARVHLFVFPPPLVRAELGHECGTASVFCRSLCLCWHPAADLKLLWMEGHDKRGVGVT
jgi:hypothetical protein